MKHFTHIEIDLSEIVGQKTVVTHFSESCFDLFMDSGAHIWEYKNDYLHGYCDSYAEAIELLKEKHHITDKEIKDNKEEIESDILRAMEGAYRDSMENGFYSDIESHAETIADNAGATGHYFIDTKGSKCELYEASELRLYWTKSQYMQEFAVDKENYYTQAEWLDDSENACHEYTHAQTKVAFNWEQFDYHGQRFDCDKWQQHLLDYAESIYAIENARKEKQLRVKSMIRNNVALETRQAIIN